MLRKCRGFILLVVFTLAVTYLAQAAPSGLAENDWAGIKEAHEKRQLALSPSGSGHEARNPGQQWRTQFDERGFITRPQQGDWSWGVELLSYGFAGNEQSITQKKAGQADGARIIYQRDQNLSEWMVNGRAGLEHGFTIASRPEGTGNILQLKLSDRGNLRPVVSAEAIQFVDRSGATVVNYHALEVWDAEGRRLPAHFVALKDGFRLEVDEKDASYPLTIDPIAQQAYLKASNTDANDHFGSSVAIFGDTVVIGGEGEASSSVGVNGNQADNSTGNAGAVYVFVRSGTTWTQQAYLKASNTDIGDYFGESVAISGDTIVVGSENEDSAATGVNGDQTNNSATSSGAAYVFVRNAGIWTQQAYLKASDTASNSYLGYPVAISGDTIVAGAGGRNGVGGVYVFVRNGSSWAQQAILTASNGELNDYFGGSSLGISGDTIVAGASDEDSAATGVNGDQSSNSASNAGAAYVFVRNGTTWTQQAYLKASNTDAGDFFGYSAAISGNTIVIGAYGEDSSSAGVNGNQSDNSAMAAGAAYVFVRSGTTWSQEAYLKASNTQAGDAFGGSVAISGDNIAVGAPFEASSATGVNGNQFDNSAANAGAAYLFSRSGGIWLTKAYLKASNTNANDFFASSDSLAISNDTVVIGASSEASAATGVNGDQTDNSKVGAGAAYIFAGLPVNGKLQNISTRAQVLTGDQVEIGGFIISGSDPKKVLVRALGPTLAQPPFNIPGTLADPLLELHAGDSSLLATNHNWKDTQQAEIAATGFAPPNDLESAIVTTLSPGNYTAIVKGENNGTGVGLVEVYDVDSGSSSVLSNISTRGVVGTGGNVMIAGLVVGPGGGTDQNVLIRALGPTLSQPPFNLSGTLSDPVLELHDQNGALLVTNDNWKDTQQSAITATGLAPANDSEAAILATLPPSNYTAIVSGKNNTTGIALVEVYRLP